MKIFNKTPNNRLSYSFSIPRCIPPSGLRTGLLVENFIGLGVFSVGTNLKLLRIVASPTLDCISPNLNPMQSLGPFPKGIYA